MKTTENNAISELHYLNYQTDNLDGEVWQDVLGYDGIYLVSNLGRVKSYQREIDMGMKGVKRQPERIMKQHVSRSNYKNLKEPSRELKVSFCVNNIKKTCSVAVLVGIAFIGQPEQGQVFSKKDKRWNNNRADNLEIATFGECFKLAYKTGNNLRRKKHLIDKQKNLFIYTRLLDGKSFTGTELVAEYKKEVRGNIRKAIDHGRNAYGSKWNKVPILKQTT